MTKQIYVPLIALVTLACGSTARTTVAPLDGTCTLLRTANLTTTPTFNASQSKVDYILEVARCDDFQLADYFGCKGSSPGDESLNVGTMQIGAEEKPAYYQSRQCNGSDLPSIRHSTPSTTEMEPQQSMAPIDDP